MIKKNSIYIKLLIPVVCIMLLQSILIGTVLFTNGTMMSLERSAIENLRSNAENRTITLENMMVRNWSNLDRLETEVRENIQTYSSEKGLSPKETISDPTFAKEILNDISESLLNALRLTFSTGTFIYFINENDFDNPMPATCQGLYFRDLDPISTPADYSDVLCLKGPVDIARKYNIPLDSLWNESFELTPDNDVQWDIYTKLLSAATQNPSLRSMDLSYWSRPYHINAQSSRDSNRCITYSRPLIFDGQVVAIIGSEVQNKQLTSYFPYSDFGESGQGGYMLVNYSASVEANPTMPCSICEVTGSYLKRMLNSTQNIVLKDNNQVNSFTFKDSSLEPSQIVLQPIKLYNTNAPFSDEQWALAAIGTDNTLFEAANRVQTGILFSSVFAFLLGVILMAFTIKSLTLPLAKIVSQVEKSDPYEPIVLQKTNSYEISLLCLTLNEMRAKRKAMDTALREERERYLIALESATDTFMEYDTEEDRFLLYFFSGEDEKSKLSTQEMQHFSDEITNIVHPHDIGVLKQFLSNYSEAPQEIRTKVEFLPHITRTESDDGYYWLALKASYLYDEGGKLKKVIGTVRDITHQKNQEKALLEANRRDLTTGFYHADYGKILLDAFVQNQEPHQTFTLCYIRIQHLEQLEARYGRVYAGLLLGLFSRNVREVIDGRGTAVRLSNEDFVLYLGNTEIKTALEICRRLYSCIPDLFVGESQHIIELQIGIASSSDNAEIKTILHYAGIAMLASSKDCPACYEDLTDTDTGNSFAVSRRPVSVMLNLSKENIVGLTFDLFEHTGDISSSIRLLLELIGRLFNFSQVLICSYDTDFDSNHVSYQWNADACSEWHYKIQKIQHADFDFLNSLAEGNGTFYYDEESVLPYSEGVRTLLCVRRGEPFNAFCCILYENGIHTGRIIFKSVKGEELNETDAYNLHETSKIISAHINIEKSYNASKAKSEFLSRMSHEIRTPMNAIIGMTGIAKEKLDEKERVSDCLNKIDFSAQHLLALINDVLDMSRIESGKMQIENKSFSLDKFIDSIEVLMRSPIEAKGLRFNIIRGFTDAGVSGDEYRLRQVIVNLLGNALKFTDSGGEVTLSVRQLDNKAGFGHFVFLVKDSGVGIKPEDQALVFRAFEQTESGINQKGGTGLGLPISSSIISAMNSKIELHSVPGQGSEFFFTLRLPFAQIIQPKVKKSVTKQQCYAGKHALLVEDNEINIEIAQYLLNEIGFEVSVALNGREALDLFLGSEPGEYDVIFMDIQMPVMDGLTATREIRKNKHHPDAGAVPIIAMTANAFSEDMKRSIEAGMNGHVSKPIDVDALHESLYTVFKS